MQKIAFSYSPVKRCFLWNNLFWDFLNVNLLTVNCSGGSTMCIIDLRSLIIEIEYLTVEESL